MIARIWHGIVPLKKCDEYLDLMRSIAIPDYKATPGNLDAMCLRRIDGDIAHFEMLTFWESLEAIKRLHESAKYYDFDDNFLIEKEPGVRHFEIYRHNTRT